MTTAAPSPARIAPLALWRVAEAFLRLLHALFGAPEEVAARHTLTVGAHALLASWLRSAEALMRRLLLIEAAAFPKPNARPLLHPTRRRARKLMAFMPGEPEKWRVGFRCVEPLRPRPPTSPQAGGTPAVRRRIAREERASYERFRSAWALAERYEALIRVFNDPAPYARRLARRLHACPHLLAEALHAPPEAAHRIDRFDEAGDQAETLWRRHFSSA